jgi:hypothetical protein
MTPRQYEKRIKELEDLLLDKNDQFNHTCMLNEKLLRDTRNGFAMAALTGIIVSADYSSPIHDGIIEYAFGCADKCMLYIKENAL